MSRPAALFDMDKTLIAENSGSVYVRERYAKGEIGRRELARAGVAYLRYKAGLLDNAAFAKSMVADLAGRSEAELAEEGRALFERAIRVHVFPEAAELVAYHRSQGHAVAIVSGAIEFVVDPLAAHLGIDHVLCTRVEIEDGVLTGGIHDPVCFDEGKLYWVDRFIQSEHVDLARSWFYTDSITDLPLLEQVGHPVVTNPDPRLYRIAVRRRWPVRFFGGDSRP